LSDLPPIVIATTVVVVNNRGGNPIDLPRNTIRRRFKRLI
jgi:hypothetical protein